MPPLAYTLFLEAVRCPAPPWEELPPRLQALWLAGNDDEQSSPGERTIRWLVRTWLPERFGTTDTALAKPKRARVRKGKA